MSLTDKQKYLTLQPNLHNNLERRVTPTDEEELRGSIFPYRIFSGPDPKYVLPTRKFHQVLRFVGKDQNYFGFNRKTDV